MALKVLHAERKATLDTLQAENHSLRLQLHSLRTEGQATLHALRAEINRLRRDLQHIM